MYLFSKSPLSIILLYFSLVKVIVIATPLVVHEKREIRLRRSIERRRIESNVILPVRIGLKHNRRAAENAEKWLMDVSHPDSPNYGRHWTQSEVVEAFAPSPETIGNVTWWLEEHGIGISEFTHSDNKMWFAFDAPASRIESLLQTEYFEHSTAEGHTKVSCDYYYLPSHLQAHVDYITPGVQESDITDHRSPHRLLKKRSSSPPQSITKAATASSSIFPSLTSTEPYPHPTGLAHCWKEVTPECLQALYNFSSADPSLPISSTNAMGLFESARDIFSQIDLDLFYSQFSPDIPVGTSPIYHNIDGIKRPYTLKNASYGGYRGPGYESDADIEIALPIIYPQNITVFEVLNTSNRGFNFFNRFFDAVDGSYCTPAQRGNSSQGGRPKCGILKPTNVLSISYDGEEVTSFTASWQKRQCDEYLKLGLQGVSVFVASGDRGVDSLAYYTSFHGGDCHHANQTGGPRVFLPDFPACCPWITSVGATQIPVGGTVKDREIAAQFYEQFNGHPARIGSSGGGFAINFPAPAYQQETLENYFTNFHPPWSAYHNGEYKNNTGRYNRDGRGFPDISSNGVNVASVAALGYVSFSGTSASSPTVAALFNRIIEERIRAGKKGPLGFINPTLYKNPGAFNDIIEGGNGFCYTGQGFTAVEGWDPVTGLGTPDYGKLLDVFLKLP